MSFSISRPCMSFTISVVLWFAIATAVDASRLSAQDTIPHRPAADSAGAPLPKPKGSGRILWILPNFSTVEEDEAKGPISRLGGFSIATKDSFDPYVLPYVGIVVTGDLLFTSVPWGRSASGIGKLYLATLVDNTIGNFAVQGVFPALLNQDPRYFQKGTGSGWERVGYSFGRVLVTRSRDGSLEPNISELAGTALAAEIGNLYYPASEHGLNKLAQRWGTQLLLDGAAFTLKEFWPDLRRALSQ